MNIDSIKNYNQTLLKDKNCETRLINNNYYIQWLKLFICILVYMFVTYFIVNNTGFNFKFEIHGIVFQGNSFNGILNQIQVMVSVYLVISNMKKGYLTALLLNLLALSKATAAVFINKNSGALIGITIYIGTLVIITIIYKYKTRLNEQIELITKQKKMLEQTAFYDNLTSLPNRDGIVRQLNSLISLPFDQQINFAFVFIDLDNFKEIDDLMGKKVGDAILKKIVRRWNHLIDSKDILGKVDGTEFALIIQRELNKNEILNYMDSLNKALQDRFVLDNKVFHIDASFGIALYPQNGKNASRILKSADIAMYKAKSDGNKSIQVFTQEMQYEVLEKIELENALQSVLEKDELYLVYQPQYSCTDSSKIRGFEALLRWQSPEFGFISPGKFIPIAEETGLINEIGEWVLRIALNKFKKIYDEYKMNSILSINISVKQLVEPSFVSMVQKILIETGFDSRYLEFEITESVFMLYPDYVMDVISKLRKMGIKIALDDFGTGYASFRYLLNIAIDTLKIDKVFIDSINQPSKKKQIVGPIIDMAHEWNVRIVAEGVENDVQLSYLEEQACDYIQGYLLSKPINEEKLYHLLSK